MKDDKNRHKEDLIIVLENLIKHINTSKGVKYNVSINSILIDVSSWTSEARLTETIGSNWDISVEIMK